MKRIIIRILLIILFITAFVRINNTNSQTSYYGKSYALVIGISRYPSANWDNLTYAEKDARGMAEFLKSQGFEVITLYNQKATKEAIISKMQDYIARKVKKNDRVYDSFPIGKGDFLKTSNVGYLEISELRINGREIEVVLNGEMEKVFRKSTENEAPVLLNPNWLRWLFSNYPLWSILSVLAYIFLMVVVWNSSGKELSPKVFL